MVAFLDTNILIHYLAGTDEDKAERCLGLLRRAEQREIEIVTSEFVIAEVVWVLQTRTNLQREDIRDMLAPIINLPGLKVPNKQLWPRIFELYCEQRVDFVDAYNAAWMERRGVHQIYTYDKDFDRVEGIERIAP